MRTTFRGGIVYTGDGFTDSFTVENGRFIRVGAPDGDGGETVDLGGRFVCAGIC